MATTPKRFAIETQLQTTPVDIIPNVGVNAVDVVRTLIFYNSSSTDTRSVTVYNVPSGGTAGTANILAVKAIAPGKTWNVIEAQGQNFEEGQKLQAAQDAGTDVNVNCSGVEIT